MKVTVPSGFITAPGGGVAPGGNWMVIWPLAFGVGGGAKPLGGGTVHPVAVQVAPGGGAIPLGGGGIVIFPSVPIFAGSNAPVIVVPGLN